MNTSVDRRVTTPTDYVIEMLEAGQATKWSDQRHAAEVVRSLRDALTTKDEHLKEAYELLVEIHWTGAETDSLFSETGDNREFMIRRNRLLSRIDAEKTNGN